MDGFGSEGNDFGMPGTGGGGLEGGGGGTGGGGNSSSRRAACDICGMEMISIQACHLLCPNCGANLDCSDKGSCW